LLQIGFRNVVEVDGGAHARLATLEDYRKTATKTTWETVVDHANYIRERKLRIAFFSSTLQGGGVALMRHSIVRFLWLIDIDVRW
jgi:hypothetical protein